MDSTEIICKQCGLNPGIDLRLYYGTVGEGTGQVLRIGTTKAVPTKTIVSKVAGYKQFALCQDCVLKYGDKVHARDLKRATIFFGCLLPVIILLWVGGILSNDITLERLLFTPLFILVPLVLVFAGNVYSETKYSRSNEATRSDVLKEEDCISAFFLELVKAEVAKEGGDYDTFWTYKEYLNLQNPGGGILL